MDNSSITPPTVITPPATPPVAETVPVTVTVPTPEIEPNYSSGGFLSRIGEFKLVEYFTFALFISASIYSIYYHRQALNDINE